MSGSATLATARLRLATAATRISETRTRPSRCGEVPAFVDVVVTASSTLSRTPTGPTRLWSHRPDDSSPPQDESPPSWSSRTPPVGLRPGGLGGGSMPRPPGSTGRRSGRLLERDALVERQAAPHPVALVALDRGLEAGRRDGAGGADCLGPLFALEAVTLP